MATREQLLSIVHIGNRTARVYAQYDDAVNPMKFTGIRADNNVGRQLKITILDGETTRQTENVRSGRNETKDISALDLTATQVRNRRGEDIVTPDDSITFQVSA